MFLHMQTTNIQERTPSRKELLEYAFNIIPRTPSFREFAVAIIDFMNEVNSSFIIDLYEELLHCAPLNDIIIDSHFKEGLDEYTFKRWYDEFNREHEEKIRKETYSLKENIDELIKRIDEYRISDKFYELISYVGKVRYLAPYNALLVNLQRPGTEIAFSIRRWQEEYGCYPKRNANPLIILVPFGPVQVLYDYESIENAYISKEKLVEEWCNAFNYTQGEIDIREYYSLIHNLSSYGIALDESLNVDSAYRGYYRKCNPSDSHEINIVVHNTKLFIHETIKIKARFLFCINHNQTPEEIFYTICRNLGHLFCRHLFYNKRKERHLTLKEEEFEAETVAWLVCKRHGVDNPYEDYLATYSRKGIIPRCSIDIIMRAVTEIEKMLKEELVAKEGLWYKNDDEFKHKIDEMNNGDVNIII